MENNRKDALEWWNTLSFDDQWDWASRVFPDWKFRIVSSSSSMIERIYNRYKNKQNGFRNEN